MIFRLRSIQPKLITLLSIFTFIFFMASCGGEEPADEIIDEVIEKTFIDNSDAEETAADTSSTGVYQEEVSEDELSLQATIKTNTEPEVEEERMSFCDCVKKNKKLSDIIMADETSDADFDKAMEELKNMKTDECEIMFSDQNTIEEQQAHQQKVKRCLK